MGRKFAIIKAGDVVGDMRILHDFRDEKNDRRMLKCACMVCGRVHNIYEGNVRDRPASTMHGLECSRGLRQYEPRLYDIWLHMKDRVKNPRNKAYYRYGGRGIDFDPRYEYYVNFFDDQCAKYMTAISNNPGIRISMDRIDNNQGYWPGNIRWTNSTTQTRNSSKVREFYAIDPVGRIYLTNNQLQFAARHGLESKHISDCLRGVQATTGGGWRFVEKNQLFMNLYYDEVAIRELYY